MSDGILHRRDLLKLSAVAATATATQALAVPPSESKVEQMELWPGAPPGAPDPLPQEEVVARPPIGGMPDRYVTGVARPRLDIFRPTQPDGRALLVMPGGAYLRVVVDKEGRETASRMTAEGITVFVLTYRLPMDGWAAGPDAPLQDAQRAIRLIRHRAPALGIDPAKLAAIGFSAGGHLAASLSVRYDDRVYAPVDSADERSARPDVVGLLYPALTMAADPQYGYILVGRNATKATIERQLPAGLVRAEHTPPTILCHAADDKTVPFASSIAMFDALQQARIFSELHVFAEGGHGFGTRFPAGITPRAWPRLFLDFLDRSLVSNDGR